MEKQYLAICPRCESIIKLDGPKPNFYCLCKLRTYSTEVLKSPSSLVRWKALVSSAAECKVIER